MNLKTVKSFVILAWLDLSEVAVFPVVSLVVDAGNINKVVS